MANTTWTAIEGEMGQSGSKNKVKFIVGGVLIAAAIIFLIVNAASGSTQLYVTVQEFYQQQDRLMGRDLRMGALVVGDSIQYTQLDTTTSRLEFDVVDSYDNSQYTMHVVVMNEPRPDLLQHEATALIEGHVGTDGHFYVNPGGLLLKCPTRYEEADPAGHPEGVSASTN